MQLVLLPKHNLLGDVPWMFVTTGPRRAGNFSWRMEQQRQFRSGFEG